MHLESDYTHPTPGEGRCRVRVFEPEADAPPGDHHVVVLTEIPDNTGRSVTNAVERLAGEVIIDNALPPNGTVVIEHCPADARATGEGRSTWSSSSGSSSTFASGSACSNPGIPPGIA